MCIRDRFIFNPDFQVFVDSLLSEGENVTNSQIREFGERYTEAWNSNEPANVAAFYSEDGSLKVNEADAAVGREAITAVAEGFMTSFPDMVVYMDSIRTTATGFEYHWRFVGTNTGPGGTGNAVDFTGWEEWTFGPDDLISQSLGNFDEDEYARQLEFGVDGG